MTTNSCREVLVGPLIPLFLMVFVATGCGFKANLWGRSVPGSHKQEFSNQLDLAQSSYDQGDFGEALKYAGNALTIDPSSQEAALSYGFTSMALAGCELYSLARGLVGLKDKGDGGAVATLTALRSVIGLTQDELLSMGKEDRFVADLPIILPSCAETVRQSVIRLSYLDQAIQVICPFIDSSVLNRTDRRQQCKRSDLAAATTEQAYFLWSMVHLTEALMFNQVLTYATIDPTQPNLQLRVSRLSNDKEVLSNPGRFLEALDKLSVTMQAIFPNSGICANGTPTTQFSATLNDLMAVEAGFSQLLSMPKTVRAPIDNALKALQAGSQQSPVGNGSLNKLRGQFGTTIAKSLATTIDDQISHLPVPITDDQKQSICESFDSIAFGSGQTSQYCD